MYYSKAPEIPPLTRLEQSSPYAKYYTISKGVNTEKNTPSIFQFSDPIDSAFAVTPGRINSLITNQRPPQSGWCIMPNGTGYVSNTVYMKDCTVDMLLWWFSWFPIDGFRFRLSAPMNHQGLLAPEAIRQRLMDYTLSPKERLAYARWYTLDTGSAGKSTQLLPLTQTDVYPDEDFGLDIEELAKMGLFTLCLTSSPIYQDTANSFVYVGRPQEGGVTFTGCFWYGWKFVDGVPRRSFFEFPHLALEKICQNQLAHFSEEYGHLADILPELYEEFSPVKD